MYIRDALCGRPHVTASLMNITNNIWILCIHRVLSLSLRSLPAFLTRPREPVFFPPLETPNRPYARIIHRSLPNRIPAYIRPSIHPASPSSRASARRVRRGNSLPIFYCDGEGVPVCARANARAHRHNASALSRKLIIRPARLLEYLSYSSQKFQTLDNSGRTRRTSSSSLRGAFRASSSFSRARISPKPSSSRAPHRSSPYRAAISLSPTGTVTPL